MSSLGSVLRLHGVHCTLSAGCITVCNTRIWDCGQSMHSQGGCRCLWAELWLNSSPIIKHKSQHDWQTSVYQRVYDQWPQSCKVEAVCAAAMSPSVTTECIIQSVDVSEMALMWNEIGCDWKYVNRRTRLLVRAKMIVLERKMAFSTVTGWRRVLKRHLRTFQCWVAFMLGCEQSEQHFTRLVARQLQLDLVLCSLVSGFVDMIACFVNENVIDQFEKLTNLVAHASGSLELDLQFILELLRRSKWNSIYEVIHKP